MSNDPEATEQSRFFTLLETQTKLLDTISKQLIPINIVAWLVMLGAAIQFVILLFILLGFGSTLLTLLRSLIK